LKTSDIYFVILIIDGLTFRIHLNNFIYLSKLFISKILL
jgi:hypothetical protein